MERFKVLSFDARLQILRSDWFVTTAVGHQRASAVNIMSSQPVVLDEEVASR